MPYLTCATIFSVGLARYGVSRAKEWLSVDCGTRIGLLTVAILHINFLVFPPVQLWCARQCWSIDHFGVVLYYQSNLYRFCGNIWLLVNSFSLLFIGRFSFILLFFGQHFDSTFTGTDRNGHNYRIKSDLRAVHSCNS